MKLPVIVKVPNLEVARAANVGAAWSDAVLQDTESPFDHAPFSRWLHAYQQQREQLLAFGWQTFVPDSIRRGLTYIRLGSAARGEDLPHSDLDFAIVSDGTVSFAQAVGPLQQFVRTMTALGFQPCRGNVMGPNPRWFGTPADWYSRIEQYYAFPDWKSARYLFMAMDATPLSPCEPWQGITVTVRSLLAASPFFLWQMAHLGIRRTVGLHPFGRVKWQAAAEGEFFDVKEQLLAPIVHAIRLLAIAGDVQAVATMARVEELTQAKMMEPVFAAAVRDALWFGWRLRARLHAQAARSGTNAERMEKGRMPQAWRDCLQVHLRTAKRLEQLVCRRFRKPRGAR
ncbi:hypothetical protein Heshes_08840 [Alicyclobacillus hesperidum]|uniref:CBS domain-containing protein n=1 Tax=Alicyclobacillus hesperidum TaxID=89784 RepID=A0A1H2R3L5_9BACL|nr:putative nucleotidyltransferase substrate binding domain-containing protein [Alicyclobacillus hesperidum]GLV13200.1 hypothetical protein Heshes_08840 [Alicyclobacillus hesperidum]SDW13977.1 CBS domain-containing protein [Alicyclobacillus hesperidum]